MPISVSFQFGVTSVLATMTVTIARLSLFPPGRVQIVQVTTRLLHVTVRFASVMRLSLRRSSSRPPPLPVASNFPPLHPSSASLPDFSSGSSLVELLHLLSSPDVQAILTLLTQLLRILFSSPQLVSRLTLLLSVFPK